VISSAICSRRVSIASTSAISTLRPSNKALYIIVYNAADVQIFCGFSPHHQGGAAGSGRILELLELCDAKTAAATANAGGFGRRFQAANPRHAL
jgi:hypothetical protein